MRLARYEALGLETSLQDPQCGEHRQGPPGEDGHPTLEPTVPARLIAAILETYHGGRTECRIRLYPGPRRLCRLQEPVPDRVRAPGSLALRDRQANSWQAWTQRGRRQLQRRRFVAAGARSGTLAQAQRHLVLIEPDGDRLPTRARFSRRGAPRRNYNLAVSLRSGGSPFG